MCRKVVNGFDDFHCISDIAHVGNSTPAAHSLSHAMLARSLVQLIDLKQELKGISLPSPKIQKQIARWMVPKPQTPYSNTSLAHIALPNKPPGSCISIPSHPPPLLCVAGAGTGRGGSAYPLHCARLSEATLTSS